MNICSFNFLMEEEEVDFDWFLKEEADEKKFDIFYKQVVEYVFLKFIYIKNNEVIYIKKIKHVINNGTFKRDQLVKCLNNNKIFQNERYSLYGLFKYNPNFSPKQIMDSDIYNDYSQIFSYIDDICYEKTIPYFSSLNELCILLKPKNFDNLTKKIKLVTTKKTKRRLIL